MGKLNSENIKLLFYTCREQHSPCVIVSVQKGAPMSKGEGGEFHFSTFYVRGHFIAQSMKKNALYNCIFNTIKLFA